MKWIFHVDMDAFFVSVEIARNPSLAGKAVVTGGSPSGRGVITSASYEARSYGIHSAMSSFQAKRLCPHLIFTHGSYDDYTKVSKQIKEIFLDFTPFVEMVSIDEAYLDMTGFDRLYGHVMLTAQRLHKRILLETGCHASIGIATNKLVAKVASGYAKPKGIFFVIPGNERSFFSHLPIEKIPGIGTVTSERLHSLGINKVGDLIKVGRKLLKMTLGNIGTLLYDKALGLGNDKINPPGLPKSIGNESTFGEDTVDRDYIESVLSYLTEKAANRLRKKKLQAKRISLKLRYSDFKTITRAHTFSFPTNIDHEFRNAVISLFRKAFTRRTRVRLVGVRLSQLSFGSRQMLLPMFAEEVNEKWQAIYEKVDEIRLKHGFQTILNAHSTISVQRRKKKYLQNSA